MEQWLPIKGYEGFYEISDLGRVRNVYANGYSIVRPTLRRNGFYYFRLRKAGTRMEYSANRLVANHFLAKPEGLDFLQFKDGNKANLSASNIEYTTIEVAITAKARGRRYPDRRGVAVAVYFEGAPLGAFRSIRKATKATSISVESVYKSLRTGKRIKGYQVSYLNGG